MPPPFHFFRFWNFRFWIVGTREQESRTDYSIDASFSQSFCRLPTSDHCHLITLSARANTLGGIVRPICLAVLRLITKSILSTPCTGKSLGLTPARIRWTYFADKRPTSWKLTL